VVLAVPVAPPSTLRQLASLTDEIVAIEVPEEMRAVGEFYRHFDQTTDAEVVELLAARQRRGR
jgi:predicted phosphoribosyltransferase